MPARRSFLSASRQAPPSDPPTSVPSPALPSTPDSSSMTTVLPHPPPALPRTFTDNQPLPRILVFDLDYTLWPFWCDTHVSLPIKALTGAQDIGRAVKDRHGEKFAFYPEVPGILAAARSRGIKLAAASRTHAPDVADQLLRMLYVQDSPTGGSAGAGGRGRPAKEFFDNMQIFPGNKVTHMIGINKALGEDYSEMLFFDDEHRNQNVEREKGVCFWLIRDGVTRDEIDRGVEKWRKVRASAAGKVVGS